jgi:hypothetical protein
MTVMLLALGLVDIPGPASRIPIEYRNVVATWATGRQTVSFRVGEFYYIEQADGSMSQHAGAPESWRYVK